MGQATKSGTGSASISTDYGLVVGALMVVNAFGEVVDTNDGKILAGVRTPGGISETSPETFPFTSTLDLMLKLTSQRPPAFGQTQNTVIGVVATNAGLSKEQANLVAQMAQDGVARSIRPAHTLVDGDTLFAISTAEHNADVNLVGALAAEAVSQAITRAVMSAEAVAGLPCAKDILNA